MKGFQLRSPLSLLMVLGLFLFSACNEKAQVEPDSPYKVENEQYIKKMEAEHTQKGYNKVLFPNADYPFYYKVLEKNTTTTPEEYPLQNSRVEVLISGKIAVNGQTFLSAGSGSTSVIIYDIINNQEESAGKGLGYALQSMKVGDHWEVILPWQLGFGSTTTSRGLIPAYSALVYDIKLIKILKK